MKNFREKSINIIGKKELLMSSVTDLYTKNYSKERRKEFEKRVREMFDGSMSEESVADLVAKQMREELKKGGLIGKPLGAGGKK